MIITIDPGLRGGIAWKKNGKVEAIKMPDTPVGIRENIAQSRIVSKPIGNGECYNYYIPDTDIVCYMEEIKGVLPNQSSKATWTFGVHYGILQGILITLGIPIVYVKPNTWQKAIGATRPSTPHGANKATKERIKREGKRNIKEIVEARYPHLRITLNTADALGILMYAEKEERK